MIVMIMFRIMIITMMMITIMTMTMMMTLNTLRPQKLGEQDGQDYFFASREKMQVAMIMFVMMMMMMIIIMRGV